MYHNMIKVHSERSRRSKGGLPAEPRDRNVLTHRSGEGQKNISTMAGRPKNTVLRNKSMKDAKPSHWWGERGSVGEVTRR